MHWLCWIVLSNLGIFWIEYVYRSGKYDSFMEALPFICVPVFVSQMGLFYGFRGASSLFMAGAAFTLINTALRLVNAMRLGETLNTYNYAGIVLLLVATFLIKMK